MEFKLPAAIPEMLRMGWTEIEPLYQQLERAKLTAANAEAWLANWSRLSGIVYEQNNLLALAASANTSDPEAEKKYNENIDAIFTPARRHEQRLKEKLLASGLTPAGLEIPLRSLRAEAALYCEANLPLLAEEEKLGSDYDEIIGAQTASWNGKERTFTEMQKMLIEENDREVREVSWRLMRERMLVDKPAIHALWRKLFALRQQVAANAGKPDYRAYAWEQKARFDYAPKDCRVLHTSIEKVVVPAASRVCERRRKRLGLETIRPWDEYVDPLARPALRPFRRVTQLANGAANIFDRLDPGLGRSFRMMIAENLLDLKSRKHKSDGAYCAWFELTRKPFIFMNAVGIHYDVQTLLHESGHAFHSLEMANLPYIMQRNPPMEFQEVASLAMELLAAPYLADSGLYAPAEAARARIESLEDILLGLPYMALVDAFQHWIYENPARGADPKKCDAKWNKLHARFIPDVDYSDIEIYRPTQWHRQGHIFQSPFYYIEYALAQLGAVQIWGNALKDQPAALASYRNALALGATASIPNLFAAAGAKLAFDRKTLQSAVDLIESQIEELEKAAG